MQRQIKCKKANERERDVLEMEIIFRLLRMKAAFRATNLAVLCLRSDKSPFCYNSPTRCMLRIFASMPLYDENKRSEKKK